VFLVAAFILPDPSPDAASGWESEKGAAKFQATTKLWHQNADVANRRWKSGTLDADVRGVTCANTNSRSRQWDYLLS
jgi:hypothetical protein